MLVILNAAIISCGEIAVQITGWAEPIAKADHSYEGAYS